MAEFHPYTLLSLQYSLYGLYLHSFLHPCSLNLYSLLHLMAIYQLINSRESAISKRI
jgi:hypothetical protein